MIVAHISAKRLDVPMREAFTIAGGAHTTVRNTLIKVRLHNGIEGWGEGAPMPAFNGETQKSVLASVREAAALLKDVPVDRPRLWGKYLDRAGLRAGCARAALEIALFDAWGRSTNTPLSALLGNRRAAVNTDVTIPIVSAANARRSAVRLWKQGIRTIKVKVGVDAESDAERMIAIHAGTPRARLIADANAGYDKWSALRFLGYLKKHRIRPALFEQPLPARSLKGLHAVWKEGGIPIAADESACRAKDIIKIARQEAAQVINIKLMKSGILEGMLMAETAKALGLGLMIGGLVETRLAMTAAAHFARALGGFSFIDLDTPFFLSRDPMRGTSLRKNGNYQLDHIHAGIGVEPREG